MGSSTHLHAGVVMLNRSLGWMLIALGFGAFTPDRVSAQGNTSTPLPSGVTACKFNALVKDIEPGGPPIRDAPRLGGREVWRLPAMPHPLRRSFTPAVAGSRENSSRRICFAIL